MEDGLPSSTAAITCFTSGSSGVVAKWSRFTRVISYLSLVTLFSRDLAGDLRLGQHDAVSADLFNAAGDAQGLLASKPLERWNIVAHESDREDLHVRLARILGHQLIDDRPTPFSLGEILHDDGPFHPAVYVGGARLLLLQDGHCVNRAHERCGGCGRRGFAPAAGPAAPPTVRPGDRNEPAHHQHTDHDGEKRNLPSAHDEPSAGCRRARTSLVACCMSLVATTGTHGSKFFVGV